MHPQPFATSLSGVEQLAEAKIFAMEPNNDELEWAREAVLTMLERALLGLAAQWTLMAREVRT